MTTTADGENQALELLAPAKINADLYITGRRSDGYHLLDSLFVPIDLYDKLTVRLASDISVVDQGLDIATVDSLHYRAIEALLPFRKHTQGVSVHLEKHIPTMAGLGGGSSDAAAMLLALNKLWQLELPKQKLAEIGLSLGADVPFFLAGSPARVTGVGENLTPIDFPECFLLLLTPQPGTSTKQIFGLYRTEHPVISTPQSIERPSTGGRNDLAPITLEHAPQVALAWNWLSRHAQPRLSGSGSTIFAMFRNQDTAQTLLKAAPEIFNPRLCRTLATSPLSHLAD